ncbi:hypothetical protein JW977_02180 [Candidatus Falkowbacteria bacterium]|nr:hypothetical protein [Candidatus Falkowbacteria bacterium]
MIDNSEHLSAPIVNDIYYQYANIKEDKGIEVILWVSDEDGLLSKEQIWKKHLFNEQFYPMDGNKDLFCCQVQIVLIEGDRIYFYFLDKQLEPKEKLGEKNLTKKQFLERFFMPQHKMHECQQSPA